MTIKQVAVISGINPGYYTNIELNRRTPHWNVIKRLESFFGIPARELMAESEEENIELTPGKGKFL